MSVLFYLIIDQKFRDTDRLQHLIQITTLMIKSVRSQQRMLIHMLL